MAKDVRELPTGPELEALSSADILDVLNRLRQIRVERIERYDEANRDLEDATRAANVGDGTDTAVEKARDRVETAGELSASIEALLDEARQALTAAVAREGEEELDALDGQEADLNAERERIFRRAAKATGELLACLAELKERVHVGPMIVAILKMIRFGARPNEPVPSELCNGSSTMILDGLQHPPDANAAIISKAWIAATTSPTPCVADREVAIFKRRRELGKPDCTERKAAALLRAAGLDDAPASPVAGDEDGPDALPDDAPPGDDIDVQGEDAADDIPGNLLGDDAESEPAELFQS